MTTQQTRGNTELAQTCKETLCCFVGKEDCGVLLDSSFSQTSSIALSPPSSLSAEQV